VWHASAESLFAGYATGDPEAAAVFIKRFEAQVFGLALLITRDRRDAEEVAQDAFVRAWRYASSYDARRGSVSSWLLRIVRNVAVDRARISAARTNLSVDDLSDNLLADPTDIADDVGRRDGAARVIAAARSLPEEQRDALLAVTLRGLSAHEFSEATGVPLGTVKTRVRLALRKLRNDLGTRVE
jgi:RNA polymerase sigma-70 factor (ECF subfamily)